MGSRRSTLSAKAGVVALTASLLATGATVLAAPASASAVSRVQASSWAFVDSAAPTASFVNPGGNAPVGAHTYANGTNHVSKSYITFDISALKGARLQSAYVSAAETAVTDCANPRTTELWLTAPAKKPTWNTQPAELVKGGLNIAYDCPAGGVSWTVTAALQRALDDGRTTATFAVRLPDDQQNDPKFGREYDPKASLTFTANKPPVKPTTLKVNGKACAKTMVVSRQAQLSAVVTDPDDSSPGAEFAFWPADHPDQRTTVANWGALAGNVVWTNLDSYLSEGVTYAWQVRGKDSLGDTGPWSGVCKFSTDFTQPATAPVITSADYTDTFPGTGGTGVPGTFTFDAKGDKDIVGFQWTGGEVAADHPGGKATVRYAPTLSGPVSINARGVDAAGNLGPYTDYRFWVASNQPGVTCTPWEAYVGQARTCVFKPQGSTPVTGYVYHLLNQDDETVAAAADGTATVTVYPWDPQQEFSFVEVRAKLSTGYLTSPSTANFEVDPGTPQIEQLTEHVQQSLPAQFRLRAVLPGSVSFTYHWNDGELITVPVGADGTVTVTVTPTTSSWGSLSGYTTATGGVKSGWGSLNANVASNKPDVTSAEYPAVSEMRGAVGTPGTFVFSSPVPGVLSYTYQFSGEAAAVTVPAGPDGTASVTFAPKHPYTNGIFVTSRLADGTVSEQGGYWFYVNYSAPRFECDPTGFSVSPGQHITCTLTPVQANLASYGYAVGSGPEVTVPPAADGSATIAFDVPADTPSGTDLDLRMWSTNTAGTRSEDTGTSFYVYVSTSASARGTSLAV